MTEDEARRLAVLRIDRLAEEAAACGACLTAFFFHFARHRIVEIDVELRMSPPLERRKSAFVYDMQ